MAWRTIRNILSITRAIQQPGAADGLGWQAGDPGLAAARGVGVWSPARGGGGCVGGGTMLINGDSVTHSWRETFKNRCRDAALASATLAQRHGNCFVQCQ